MRFARLFEAFSVFYSFCCTLRLKLTGLHRLWIESCAERTAIIDLHAVHARVPELMTRVR